MDIGSLIRKYRKSRGMTQEELGLAIGLQGKTGICKIETGKSTVSYETVMAISKALNINPIVFMEQFQEDKFIDFHEYLPYLSTASEETIRNIRFMLGMPPKKILKSTKEIV